MSGLTERSHGRLSAEPRLPSAIWLGYLLFVIYGSLVPLDFRPLPVDQAWLAFRHTPMYELGVASRADWVANGVLYVPVGFLTTHLLIQGVSGFPRPLLLLIAGLFSVALAGSVEFAQIFFPPRSVSLNDLLAESIGSLIGLALAARYSDWFRTLLHAVFGDSRRLIRRLAEAYLVGYLAFSLFPYDLLLSGVELEQKIRGDSWGWLLAGDPQGAFVIALKTLAEIILTLPFGLYLGYRAGRRSPPYALAILLGIFLGGLIEIAQFFIASGVSQGLSVVTRCAGVCGGLALWQHRADWSAPGVAALTQRYALALGALYLLALLHINGWFSSRWNGIDFAAARLGEMHFLPLYYHYFTSEAKALVSLSVVGLSYLPVGLLGWANRGTPRQAFIYAALVAGLVETGKLFVPGMRPDPSNVVIAALASWAALHLASALSNAAPGPSTADSAASRPPPSAPTRPPAQRIPVAGKSARRWAAWTVLWPSLAFAAYWAATFPTQPLWLCLFLGTCGVVIWQRPARLVTILLACLPILDLAPWSGRFFFDEFDLLLLVGLAIAFARVPPVARRRQNADVLLALAGSLLATSFAVSAVRGLIPWQTPGANAFANYYSAYNALRIGKGALWAWLAFGVLRRMVAAGIDVRRQFTWGLVVGLALTVAVVFWERVAFSGLFNFTSDYRVTGPFSAMHTGGAYIECFLAMATPFLILLLLQTSSRLIRLAGVALLLATTYALMVTFSRNGYAAFGVALIIILLFTTVNVRRWQQRSLIAAALTAAMLAVAVPVFTGQFAQSRMATVRQDYDVRHQHWQDALDMRAPDWLTTLFGMGLGRYPQTHYLLSREGSRSATYQLMSDDQNTYLRLASGSSIYVEQLVPVKPRQTYVLKLDVRADKPNVEITIPICEKWLLASYNCIWSSLNVGRETGVWRHLEARLSADPLHVSPWYSRRPIKLALYNGNGDAIVDVDNVRLETIEGGDLLRNGDFSGNLDHWFFSADSHLQWHTKSLSVAVLFDQGWFGLLALGLFSLLAIGRAARRAWQGELFAAAVLAAFMAFLVVGLFDTLIDAPRFLLLFLLLGGFCGFRNIAAGKEPQA